MRARVHLLWGALFLATAVPVVAGFSGTDLFLANVGRQAGVFPSNWYTTVWIYNPGAAAATARLYLLERGTVNLSPPFVDVLVAPGDTEKLENVVESLFHKQVFGALRVTCVTQKLVVTGRVYSKGAGAGEKDSAGQDFAGVPAAFAVGVGEKTQVLGVYQTQPSAGSDYRFNFGMVETTGNTANVRVTAYDGNNASQGSTDVTVRAYSQGQWAFKDRFPSVSTENVRLEVQVLSGTGKVIAYGSGITNGSQDPTTFEMQYADTLLGAATVLQHDATLTGAGTAGSPLGVADAGVTPQKIAPSGTAGQVLATVAGGSPAPGGVAAAAAGSAVAWQGLGGLSLGLAAKGVTFGNGSGGLAQDATAFVWDATHHRLGLGTATPQDQLELTGNLRLPATAASSGVATAGVLILGGQSFLHGYGAPTNTFVGAGAGNFTMTGNTNTAVGSSSLHADTTGQHNTAVGTGSLSANTTGTYDTAVGALSLTANTTGINNAALGANSLQSNTTGGDSTALGNGSLQANSTGNENTAVGSVSLNANTTGGSNTAVGTASLNKNTTGSNNTAIGHFSLLFNTIGEENTASGRQSLYSNTTGTSNTATGSQSLYSETTAVGNTASGAQSLYSDTTGFDNTASGISSLWSNTTGAENTATGDQALQSNTTGNDNTAIGGFALYANTTGNANTAIGTSAGDTNLSGSNNTFLGTSADALVGGLTNATAVGHGAKVDAANHIRIGDSSVTQIGGQVAWSNLSDARHKSNVRDLDLGRDFVMALRPVSFTVNGGDGRTDMGFLAQEVEALLGDGYNVLGVGADPERTLSLRYTDLIAPLVKAVQEQQAQLAAQARTIAEQQAQIAAEAQNIQSQQALIGDLLARVTSIEKATK